MPQPDPDTSRPPGVASGLHSEGSGGDGQAGRHADGAPGQPIEDSFRHFAESLRDLVWSARPDGVSDYYNGRFLDYLGKAREEMGGWTWAEALHPDDAGRALRAWEQACASGGAYEAEFRIRRHDGAYRWHRGHASPMRDARGRIVRWFGTCTDVDFTGRTRAEEYLALQARVLESMTEGVSVADEGGTIVYTNPAEDRIFGYGAGELVGRHVTVQNDYPPEENARIVAGVIAQLKARGSWSGEWRNRRKDGTPFRTFARITAIERGGRTFWVCVQEDLSERQRDEAALREAEGRLAAIVDHCPAVISLKDREGRYLLVNRRFEELARASGLAGPYLGRTDAELLPPEVAGPIRRDDLEVLETGRVKVSEEPSHLGGGGRTGLTTNFPLLDAEGEAYAVCGIDLDVTGRRRAEEQVRFQAHLLASVGQAVIATDPEGRILYWNHFAESLYGWAEGEAKGRNIQEVVVAPGSAVLAAEIMARMRAGEGWSGEFAVRRRDGAIFHAFVTDTPVFDDRGRLEAIIGVSMDVTDRKRAEEVMRASEERFRHLADAMPQIVWVTRPDRSVEFVNRRWLEYTGLSPEASLGPEGWIAAIHPEDLARVREASVRSHAAGEPFEAEYRLRDVSGAYRWHLGRAVPICDEAGRVVRRFGAATDIDDRRRAEQAARFLAEASATLSALVDEAGTLEKVARLAVPTFADWCSVDMAGEGSLTRRLAVAHVHPAKVQQAHDLYRRYPPDPDAPLGAPRVIRTGESLLVAEITDEMLVAGTRDDAHLALIRDLGLRSYMCVPLKGRGGTLGAITFVAAESGRRYGPEDLRLVEDLASRAVIAIENARLYAALREADRRKDEFLATLAHELRNPLAPIRNALHLMAYPDEQGNAHEADRAMAERQVVHLARLVDDLMDVSRINQGKVELRREAVDLAAVVGRAVETVGASLRERGHELSVTLPDAPIRLEADPTRLEQVLGNLLNNAIKYTEPGGRIAIAAGREGGEVVLWVRDDGIGIEPEMLPEVFGLFVQTGHHTGHSQGGLGIGLSLVKTLVELHGGTIRADSRGPGTGSEFVVRLPALPEAGEVTTTARDPRRSPGDPPQCRRILVVDDNVDAARSLARLLRKLHGQEVQVAHDGPEALAVASEFLPDVILLDIGLPIMDGNEVARRLRERPESRGTLIVALTGWGQEGDRLRSQEAGIDHHLVKPVDPDGLMELIGGSQRLRPR